MSRCSSNVYSWPVDYLTQSFDGSDLMAAGVEQKCSGYGSTEMSSCAAKSFASQMLIFSSPI